MDCEQVQQWVHPYLDGELSRPKARAIRNHVEACSECMDLVIDYHSLGYSLESYDIPDRPDGFTGEVITEVRNRAGRDRLRNYGRVLGLVATLLLGIFLGTSMAVDVSRTMDRNGARTASGAGDRSATPVGTRQEAFQTETFSEVTDDSLSDRFVRIESTTSEQPQSTP